MCVLLPSLYISLHISVFTFSRERLPALRRPPGGPAHDGAGEGEDGPGSQLGREQGPLPHECVRGGHRPQRGGGQGWTHGGGGRAAGGKGVWKRNVRMFQYIEE